MVAFNAKLIDGEKVNESVCMRCEHPFEDGRHKRICPECGAELTPTDVPFFKIESVDENGDRHIYFHSGSPCDTCVHNGEGCRSNWPTHSCGFGFNGWDMKV